jgi:hypothetical protein
MKAQRGIIYLLLNMKVRIDMIHTQIVGDITHHTPKKIKSLMHPIFFVTDVSPKLILLTFFFHRVIFGHMGLCLLHGPQNCSTKHKIVSKSQ